MLNTQERMSELRQSWHLQSNEWRVGNYQIANPFDNICCYVCISAEFYSPLFIWQRNTDEQDQVNVCTSCMTSMGYSKNDLNQPIDRPPTKKE